MKDTFNISVVAKIKNGALYQAIKRKGWTNRKAADFLGVSEKQIGLMINLKSKPPFIFSKYRSTHPKVESRAVELTEKLMELTGKTVEDLFPEAVMTKEFLSRSKQIEANKDVSIGALLSYTATLALPPAPDEVLMQQEMENDVTEILSTLTREQQHAINEVYLEGKTCQEVGREQGVSGQCISFRANKGIKAIKRELELKELRVSRKLPFKP